MADGTRTRQSGPCSVDGCDNPARKRGWCAAHYSQQYRTGSPPVPFGYKWATEKRCVVCGATDWPGRGRKVCSGACRQIYQRHGTERPRSIDCVLCGVEVDLTERGKAGRIKRTDTLLCRTCRRRHYLRHGKSASVLAARDGTDCQLCSDPVDMALAHPHPLSASVDHIVPRAHGGSDDLDNLQLSHLTCNQKKHTRIQAP
jgi:hypothetical protein